MTINVHKNKQRSCKHLKLCRKIHEFWTPYIVGYYSLGLELNHAIGMELYVKHDYTDRFNKDYVRQQYGAQSSGNLLLFNKAETSQLGKNWSFGVKMRIFY